MKKPFWTIRAAAGLACMLLVALAGAVAADPTPGHSTRRPGKLTRLRDPDGLKIHPIAALNTKFKENEASFSQDGRTVYFACFGRSKGSPDICVSHLTGDYRQDRRHH